MRVEEFMVAAEGAIQEALETFFRSVQELDELPRPLFKVLMEKLGEKEKRLLPPIPLGGSAVLTGAVAVSSIEYHDIPRGIQRKHLVLKVFIIKESESTFRLRLNEVVFRISPKVWQEVARRILSELHSETPGEALRVVEALEGWVEKTRGLLKEVEAEYAAALEREKEALEALKLRGAIQGLGEE
jgi:hypothetical protein